jgi:subtilisin
MSDGRSGRGSRTSSDSVVLLRSTHAMSAEALLAKLGGGAPLDDRDILSTGGGPLLAHLPVAADALRVRASKELGGEMTHAVAIEPNRIIQRGTAVQTGGIVSPAVPFTWALDALGITSASPTGKGTAVAVLDGGLDFNHPDFLGRVAGADVARIIDADPQDRDGHGTHCAGIVAGPSVPSWGPRYGVAPDTRLLIANIYASGKETTDWHLLRGLFWAAERGADVVSLSLRTAPRDEVEPFSALFEQAAQFLLDRYGMIIVAAAGNSSDRWEPFIGPLEHPADCPSVIAVGAVNRKLRPARFSAGGVPPQRLPTFVAPGVAIDSAYAISRSGANPPYRALTGTSEAAPYAAGVAALWIEHGFRGHALVGQLLASVKPLPPFSERAVGAGLVQAPR